MNYNQLLNLGLEAAVKAGKEIINIYKNTETIDYENKKDNSPLTIADTKSHNIICQHLKKTEINIISEESNMQDYNTRKNWKHYWLIDPLDGTKEFIKKNGEFTVNIAFMKENKPIIGIVYCPTKKTLYWNHPEKGGFKKKNKTIKLKKRKSVDFNKSNLRIITSRSHMNSKTENFISKLKNPKTISCGSSLKILLLAENKADIYPRFGPTMEWDTAAAHAIANSTNIKLFDTGADREILYNKKNLLNPYFVAHS